MIEVKTKGENEKYNLEELYEILRMLRSPEGCPWDMVQTHETLIKPMIEEAYEAVDAIEKHSRDKLVEELGDVLLQVIMHSIIAEESGEYTFEDVTDGGARKMLGRHSHVFGDAVANDAGQALNNWEEMKRKEKGFHDVWEDIADIPQCFPSLMRAAKRARKLRKAGEADNKIREDILPKIDYSDPKQVSSLLYSVCAKAEEAGVDCETALLKETLE